MRPVTFAVIVALAASSFACDDRERVEKLQKLGEPAPLPSTTVASATSPRASADAAAGAAADMPERPVPKTSPTVSSTMPAETQMKAIAYMAAMAAPRYDDPFVDAAFVKQLTDQLVPVVHALDTGSAGEKARLDKVEVVGGGRRIDLEMAGGCDAQTPTKAVVGRANLTLDALRSHGVLVVACHDAHVQCLQSTRDATDVLCTTAPRH